MNLRIFDDTGALMPAMAKAIEQRVDDGARSIALSGGSTPKPLYSRLGKSERLRAVPITWVVVDERYVPFDDPQSNAGMMQQTLFADGMSPNHRFLPFRTEIGDPAETARAFERDWKTLGIDTLDLIVLGIGDDGHTASLFPGTTALDVAGRIATEVYVPRLETWRVTLTKDVIRSAAMRYVLATGASKAPVIAGVRERADYPITTVTADTQTWWFVDRAAAGTDSRLS
jgi:6-phosphogluconolactonase